MRRYSCTACQNEVHFDNTMCVSCGHALGYAPMTNCMLSEAAVGEGWTLESSRYRACKNRMDIGCNWLLDADDPCDFCLSCRHTRLIPDLTAAGNVERWAKLERAKRAVIYSVLRFGLPMEEVQQGGDNPLLFEFKADVFTRDGFKIPVMTGHDNGLITVNVAEADEINRESQREAMGENYRTLVGHFRHEIGHYYWDRLVAGTARLPEFRQIFGDETQDYASALQRHYQYGPPAGWDQNFVSNYASSHPWEDFAETFAHYFHMIDGLETASNYGIDLRPFCKDGQRGEPLKDPYVETDLDPLVRAWVPLTVALNAVNRSIGYRDFYPFVLSDTISGKLGFIHALTHPSA
jgi:hypothetical protein